jgi:uncharacterized membrane protein
MYTLVVIAYPGEADAAARRDTVRRWVDEGLLTLHDAVAVTVGADGVPRLHQELRTPGAAASAGALFGGIAGSVFLGPLVGTLAGAALGGLSGRLIDRGIPDAFAREVGAQLRPHTSALFLLVAGADVERLEPRLHELGGRVLQTTLPAEAEARLRHALAGEGGGSGRG